MIGAGLAPAALLLEPESAWRDTLTPLDRSISGLLLVRASMREALRPWSSLLRYLRTFWFLSTRVADAPLLFLEVLDVLRFERPQAGHQAALIE
eukprot:6916829-Alexandrium_andersonii.AAC.1